MGGVLGRVEGGEIVIKKYATKEYKKKECLCSRGIRRPRTGKAGTGVHDYGLLRSGKSKKREA